MAEKICFAVLYLVEAFIAWIYYEHLFERRKSLPFILISFAAGYALLFGVYWLDITIANTISFCTVNALLLYLDYRCGIKSSILHAAFLSFIMTGAEILINLIIGLFGYEFSAYTYNFSVMVLLMVLSKILYLVFSVIGARVFTPHKEVQNEPKMMVLFCGLPIISMLVSILVAYIGLGAELNSTSELLIVINVFSLLVVNLIILILYNGMQRANSEYMTLQLSMQQDKAAASYYEALQEHYDSQRMLIHDIKNHLQSIEGLAADGRTAEIVSYISGLEKELTPISRITLSADPILNTVLVRYGKECEKLGIGFQLDLRENGVKIMDAPDTSVLFGNLLSNAMEAAEDSGEKLVELSVVLNAEQGTYIVAVTNSCDTPPLSDDSLFFHTRKKDAHLHGIGLRSISRVVKKYNGIETMYYDASAKKFHHIMQFPI